MDPQRRAPLDAPEAPPDDVRLHELRQPRPAGREQQYEITTPAQVPGLRAAVAKEARDIGFDDDELDDVRNAIAELLQNVFKHGRFTARMTIITADGWLTVILVQLGSWCHVPDLAMLNYRSNEAEAPDIRDAERGGNGLRIANTLSTELKILADGQVVVITFRSRVAAVE
jgi:anti-sigma regulatory factor (Ser/Thr protein kinase)